MMISLLLLLLAGEKRNNMLDGLISFGKNLFTQQSSQPPGLIEQQPITDFNNPGNIEIGQGYAGETGETYADRFSTFDSPQMGIRAIAKDITTKIKRFDGNLLNIINQYAPNNENDTQTYYNFVKNKVGKTKVSEKDVPAIVEAIIRMENQPEIAEQYLNKDIFNEAMDLAKYNLDSNMGIDEARSFIRDAN